MIKFKKKDTDNILIRVKGISGNVKELLHILLIETLNLIRMEEFIHLNRQKKQIKN